MNNAIIKEKSEKITTALQQLVQDPKDLKDFLIDLSKNHTYGNQKYYDYISLRANWAFENYESKVFSNVVRLDFYLTYLGFVNMDLISYENFISLAEPLLLSLDSFFNVKTSISKMDYIKLKACNQSYTNVSNATYGDLLNYAGIR